MKILIFVVTLFIPKIFTANQAFVLWDFAFHKQVLPWHCTALHWAELNWNALHYRTLNYTARLYPTLNRLQCTTMHCPLLPCNALHYTALLCPVLNCTALHGTAPHCTVNVNVNECALLESVLTAVGAQHRIILLAPHHYSWENTVHCFLYTALFSFYCTLYS